MFRPRAFPARPRALAAVSFAALSALPACGGHIILGAFDSGEPAAVACASDSDCLGAQPGSCQQGECTSPADGGAGRGTGTGEPFPICPKLQPYAGEACPIANQGCAYVDLQAGTCASWTCSAGMQWQSSTPAGC